MRCQALNADLPKAMTNACCISQVLCPKQFASRSFAARPDFQRSCEAKVFSLDHETRKGVPILRIDISDANQRAVLEELMDKLLCVHLAPPCGTASAARQIKPGPPPLRSVIFPVDLPHSILCNQPECKFSLHLDVQDRSLFWIRKALVGALKTL